MNSLAKPARQRVQRLFHQFDELFSLHLTFLDRGRQAESVCFILARSWFGSRVVWTCNGSLCRDARVMPLWNKWNRNRDRFITAQVAYLLSTSSATDRLACAQRRRGSTLKPSGGCHGQTPPSSSDPPLENPANANKQMARIAHHRSAATAQQKILHAAAQVNT